jgi:CRISPR-associated protein Cmr2
MATYVFSLGLIPVQEWIAEARRSRDLRAGSVFLCHGMARVLTAVLERTASCKLLFPAVSEKDLEKLAKSFPSALGLDYGIPNRASGYCEAAGDDAIREVFGRLSEVVEKSWRELKDGALQAEQGSPQERKFWRDLGGALEEYRTLTRDESDCPLSLVWVAKAAAFPREEKRANLQEIDLLYQDVKRSRPIRRWPLGAEIGKCNQCGRREAIGERGSFAEWRDGSRKWAENAWIRRGWRLDPGERLCYVCLAKRMAVYRSGPRFPSTGEIAIRPWLKRVEAMGETRQDLRDALASVKATELWEADPGAALRASEQALRERDAGKVIEPRRRLRAAIVAAGRGQERPVPAIPPGYLALIAFDGDFMGRRVLEAPEEIPPRLERFAAKARQVLEDGDGEIFYLAGDEGLAMAPASGVLKLAAAIRQGFANIFRDLTPALTLSMGVALFEHGRPMAGAIRAAREVLEQAKAREGKNSLGIAVETASGSRWSFVEAWGAAWDRVEAAVNLIQEGRLSPGWAYDVESFLAGLPPAEWRKQDLREAAREEVRRLFLRRLEVEGKSAEEKRANRREAWSRRLQGDAWWEEDAEGRAPGIVPEQFHLIGFLARQGLAPEDRAAAG